MSPSSASSSAQPPARPGGESPLGALSILPARSRSEQLADVLAEHIDGKGLRGGDRVGTLEDIRAETGFARATVSEAVRLLRERGRLEIRPGRGGGIYVAAQTPVVRMRHTLLSAQAGADDVAYAIELRESLEEPVARAAARTCTPRDARDLRDAVRALAESADYETFIRRNWALHERIAELCPNPMMGAVYTSCLGYLVRTDPSYDDVEAGAYIAQRAAVHQRLVEAIIAADASAIAHAVREHNLGTDTDLGTARDAGAQEGPVR